ncbi:uncharacterized protein Z519_11902 [Cladophialophora bantiana CBS 173.52]|uniref:Aromatic prenyltransferase n=1 Tax=Cladophialophora bantiana (strain ATCC 10958 / CBS 173.52 / CDC B-1940 / NIH 8579) TaxID=1442370 RepID=A0A0D2FLK4_CLAB1|nr:uncharacterized protein Z519_11902 [Cladophialophora bantiana CBS 173.52]KIW87577.1 hypothetical protein Z519_11902 [Cladophialophora bantiana CBS 173.52]
MVSILSPTTVPLPSVEVVKKSAEETQTNGTTTGANYWWNTSGADLSRMLQEASYPDDVRRHFLDWYRDNICPLLGGRPQSDSPKCAIGWDGNPLEFSFELKGSIKKQAVRFVVDLSQLRPQDSNNLLNPENTQKLVDVLSKEQHGFDDQWYKILKEWFVYDHLPIDEQRALIEKAGQSSPVIVGFDIGPKLEAASQLPVMGKVYFLPCFRAAAQDVTHWQAVSAAIYHLPNVHSYPNILKSCQMITDYLSDKPEPWRMGTRWLATDLISPAKARLKVYNRCFATDFDSIWDYYTLGGRIPNLDGDKDKFRDLMDCLSGVSYEESRSKDEMNMKRFSSMTKKLTAVYFALSADHPYPVPKLCLYPSNFAPNDQVIARGLDTWLTKHGWEDDGKSVEKQVKSSFTHRALDERTGIFTFIGIGPKGDPTQSQLTIQAYVTPELYIQPRY